MTCITETGIVFDLISDFYKDANGFRPSSSWLEAYEGMTFNQRKQIHIELDKKIMRDNEVREAEEARALARLKDQMILAMEHPKLGINGWRQALVYVLGCEPMHCQDLEHSLWLRGIAVSKFQEISRKFYEKAH